jgi:hypothetical protein
MLALFSFNVCCTNTSSADKFLNGMRKKIENNFYDGYGT